MSQQGLNKPIVTKGVQIVSGKSKGVSMTPSGENNGAQGELVQVDYTLSADWDGIRYFAIDYDSGSDTNTGWSDVSMADAGTKALKTIEELQTRLPRLGNGQDVVIAIKNRAGGATYLRKDGITPDFIQLTGYIGYNYMLVRGTGTVATAGAVAFANDTADKLCCGSQIVSGTNAGGYNPVAPITANTFDVQLAGGGAPGLAAEPGLIGKRIRFDSATTTVALQNATAMIWMNTSTNIIVGNNLPATPVAADIFYIEEPAVAVDYISSSVRGSALTKPPAFTTVGVFFAGLRTTSTQNGTGGFHSGFTRLNYCWIDCQNTGTSCLNIRDFGSVSIIRSYVDETLTTRILGVGFRGTGLVNVISGTDLTMQSSALINTLGRPQVTNVTSVNVGSGSYMFGGVLLQDAGRGALGGSAIFPTLIGRGNSTTSQRLRVLGTISGGAVNVTLAGAQFYGIDITGATDRMIFIRGIGLNVAINDIVGSTGNTGFGIALQTSRGSEVVAGVLAANSFSTTTGQEIAMDVNSYFSIADLLRTDIYDASKNHIQGTGNSVIGTTILFTNNNVAVIEQYRIIRFTGNGIGQKALADASATAIAMGVTQSQALTSSGNTIIVNAGGTWCKFDVPLVAGDVGKIAYLSTANAGQAQIAIPTVAGTNQKLRLGRIQRVDGTDATLGFINFRPEILSVLADGAA